MESKDMILEKAREVIETEASGVAGLAARLDGQFVTLVEWILAAKGRVVVAGIGKSGLVGRKIVATLNSTGTPSLFLHPVEAVHGDLGMVGKDDVFLALSNSGETDELNVLIPSIRRIGCPVAALTGKPDSTLANMSDLVIDVGVEREACPLGLAPTSSTTALMAMGDALAVVLIEKHHFTARDFRKFHPGGALGQRLSAKVASLMLTGDRVPAVPMDTPLTEAVAEMDRMDLGAVLVTDDRFRLCGIITDGDLRRLLLKSESLAGHVASDAMTIDPKAVLPDHPAGEALNLMENHLITVLAVTDQDRKVLGILHLHDILGKGEVRFNGASA